MILKNRLFEKEPPSEDAKKIFIFCEGKKREKDYFNYFKEIDSRINIEVYELEGTEDNSPLGLLEIAKTALLSADTGPYQYEQEDEVWLVMDIDQDKSDSRTPQFDQIKQFLADKSNWHLALSNPCFEVWLFYHISSERRDFAEQETCKAWKREVNQAILGGFDSRKHPILIKEAVQNAAKYISPSSKNLNLGQTQVLYLGEVIYETIGDKLKRLREKIQ